MTLEEDSSGVAQENLLSTLARKGTNKRATQSALQIKFYPIVIVRIFMEKINKMRVHSTFVLYEYSVDRIIDVQS